MPKLVSNPSRGYSTFLRRAGSFSVPCRTVSNPSRGYSTFLPAGNDGRLERSDGSFKPFQGLFYISTIMSTALKRWCCPVSNPSRGYSTFLLRFVACVLICEIVSNPSRGYSTFLRWKCLSRWWTTWSFKPFQGLFYISTRCRAFMAAYRSCFKPFQGLFYIST